MVAERDEFAKSHWIICFKWVPLGKLYVDEKLFKSIPGVDRTEKGGEGLAFYFRIPSFSKY